MRWPLVARSAYEVLLDERNRLRAQNDELFDHLRRMDRIEHGTSEVPKPKKLPQQPMPERLIHYFQGIGNSSIRRESRNTAFKRHVQGESWDSIMQDLIEEEPT